MHIFFIALLLILGGYVFINYMLKYISFDNWMAYNFYKYENKIESAITVFQKNSKITSICNYNDYLYYKLDTGESFKIYDAGMNSPKIKEVIGENLFSAIDDAEIMCAIKHTGIIELDIGGGHDSIFGFAYIVNNSDTITDSQAYSTFKNEFSGASRTELLKIERINKNWLWYYYTE